VEELRGLAKSGVPTSMIALHLGRSIIAIRSKAAAIGVRVSETGRDSARHRPRATQRPGAN
jgi:hypothetical protein